MNLLGVAPEVSRCSANSLFAGMHFINFTISVGLVWCVLYEAMHMISIRIHFDEPYSVPFRRIKYFTIF